MSSSHARFRFALLVPFLVMALGQAACSRRRIPGTEIEDTRDTRAILTVMEHYRSAVEARDPKGVIKLVSPDFKDDGGSAAPEDDLHYKELESLLQQRLSRVADVKLELNVKKIRFHEDESASAVYNYTTSFKMPGLTSKTESASEIKQMWFKREGDDWKIVSGI